MDGVARFKVPDGKLVVAKVSYGESFEKVELTGDFFVYPEEGVYAIESELTGFYTGTDQAEMAGIIKAVVEEQQIQLVGVDPESIARVVKEASTG